MTRAERLAEAVERYKEARAAWDRALPTLGYNSPEKQAVQACEVRMWDALSAYRSAPPVNIERLVRENARLTVALRDACIDHYDECRCAHCELVFRSSAVLREAGVVE